MSKYVTEQQFKQWVENYYQEFCRRNDFVAYAFGAGNPKHKGIIIINIDNGKIARSYCHPDDEWDYKTGLAVAYAHYMGIEVLQVEKSYFIEDLVGKEVKWYQFPNEDTPTTVFVTPYKKGGYQVVVNKFTSLSFKVNPHLLIREHDIKQ
jgi:hypothetical protein